MNAIDLLKNDHRRVSEMIERLEHPNLQAVNVEMFEQLKDALETHTRMEERVFYPELEDEDETRRLIEESYREHHQVDEILARLDGMKDQTLSDGWAASFNELKRSVKHHVTEEEQELFPQAENLLGATRLLEMAYEMDRIRTGQSETESMIYPASRVGPKE